MNLDLFVDPKFLDPCIKEQHDRVSHDSLYVAVDLSQENTAVSNIRSFVEQSLEGAEKIVEGTVRRIRAFKTKELDSHGDSN